MYSAEVQPDSRLPEFSVACISQPEDEPSAKDYWLFGGLSKEQHMHLARHIFATTVTLSLRSNQSFQYQQRQSSELNRLIKNLL